MRRSNKLLAAAWAALAVAFAPAAATAAIGTPQSLGGSFGSANTTFIQVTTGAASPAGAMIFVVVSTTSGGGTPTITDGAGNAYTQIGATQSFGLAGKHSLFYSANAAALASSSFIRAEWVGDAKPVINTFSVTGIATSSPVDVVTTPVTGSSGFAPSVSTGLLAQADELVIGYTGVDDNPGGWTVTSGFSGTLTKAGGGGNNESWLEWKVVASSASVTSAPVWTNSRVFGHMVVTFKAAGGAPPPSNFNRMLTLGVGQ